jgi:hypothetical protein
VQCNDTCTWDTTKDFNHFWVLHVLVRMDFINSHYIKTALLRLLKTSAISSMKENDTLTHQAPVTGSASFPLNMNNGNRMENTHPL